MNAAFPNFVQGARIYQPDGKPGTEFEISRATTGRGCVWREFDADGKKTREDLDWLR